MQARKAQSLNQSIIVASLILGFLTSACGSTSDEHNTGIGGGTSSVDNNTGGSTSNGEGLGGDGGSSDSTSSSAGLNFTQVSCPNSDAGSCITKSINGVTTTNPQANVTLYFWLNNAGTDGTLDLVSKISTSNGGRSYTESKSFVVKAGASYAVTVVIPIYENGGVYTYAYTSFFPKWLQFKTSFSHYYCDGPPVTTMVEY